MKQPDLRQFAEWEASVWSDPKAAIQIVRGILKQLKDSGLGSPIQQRDELALAFARRLSRHNPQYLLRESGNSFFIRRGMELFLANKLRRGGALDAAYNVLAAAFLDGTATTPARDRGKLPNDDVKLVIYILVEVLCKKGGYSATRNDATTSRASACDIVAEALAAESLSPMTYAGVKKAYHRPRKEHPIAYWVEQLPHVGHKK